MRGHVLRRLADCPDTAPARSRTVLAPVVALVDRGAGAPEPRGGELPVGASRARPRASAATDVARDHPRVLRALPRAPPAGDRDPGDRRSREDRGSLPERKADSRPRDPPRLLRPDRGASRAADRGALDGRRQGPTLPCSCEPPREGENRLRPRDPAEQAGLDGDDLRARRPWPADRFLPRPAAHARDLRPLLRKAGSDRPVSRRRRGEDRRGRHLPRVLAGRGGAARLPVPRRSSRDGQRRGGHGRVYASRRGGDPAATAQLALAARPVERGAEGHAAGDGPRR